MSVDQIIHAAFPDASVQVDITDDFIRSNQNFFEIDNALDPLAYLPAYMLWCVKNKDDYDQLVTDCTIDAIAYFGRTVNQPIATLDLKKRCSTFQRQTILAFLYWCQESLEIVDEQQIERAIKQWKK